MLPSHLRLRRNIFNDFQKKDPKMVFNRLGTFKYVPFGQGFSVVTSSKQEKKAVLRNKLRRRVYSLFQSSKPDLTGVLFVSKHAYSMDFDEIKKLFNDLLSKISQNS
jgi:RNase P protein component